MSDHLHTLKISYWSLWNNTETIPNQTFAGVSTTLAGISKFDIPLCLGNIIITYGQI